MRHEPVDKVVLHVKRMYRCPFIPYATTKQLPSLTGVQHTEAHKELWDSAQGYLLSQLMQGMRQAEIFNCPAIAFCQFGSCLYIIGCGVLGCDSSS